MGKRCPKTIPDPVRVAYHREVSANLRQPVDILVQVRLLSGVEQWILVHTEVQSSPQAGFERRTARYHSGLFWIYDQRVITR